MTAEDILGELKGLSKAEKEKFYFKVMDGFYDTMMSNQKFMEEAFHCMASYLVKMKEMGLDVNSVIREMEVGIGMAKKAAA